MGSQQFCLRWNNHQTNMLSVFDQLLQSEDFVDVTLACEGPSIKAHKVVLSACSPYFQSLFKENPCKHPIVILKDMKYSELRSIVDFMYKGEINVSQEQLSTLLKSAETLKIKGLAEVSSGAVPPSLNQLSNQGSGVNGRGGGDDTDAAGGTSWGSEETNQPQTSNGNETMEIQRDELTSPRRKRHRTSRRASDDESLEALSANSVEIAHELITNVVPKTEPVDFDYEPPVALFLETNSNLEAKNDLVAANRSNYRSPLWKHYTIGIRSHAAICNYCHTSLKRKRGSTWAMNYHLLTMHKREHKVYLKDARIRKRVLKKKLPNTERALKKKLQIKERALKKKLLNTERALKKKLQIKERALKKNTKKTKTVAKRRSERKRNPSTST